MSQVCHDDFAVAFSRAGFSPTLLRIALTIRDKNIKSKVRSSVDGEVAPKRTDVCARLAYVELSDEEWSVFEPVLSVRRNSRIRPRQLLNELLARAAFNKPYPPRSQASRLWINRCAKRGSIGGLQAVMPELSDERKCQVEALATLVKKHAQQYRNLKTGEVK
jgi:hypothetical protein